MVDHHLPILFWPRWAIHECWTNQYECKTQDKYLVMLQADLKYKAATCTGGT